MFTRRYSPSVLKNAIPIGAVSKATCRRRSDSSMSCGRLELAQEDQAAPARGRGGAHVDERRDAVAARHLGARVAQRAVGRGLERAAAQQPRERLARRIAAEELAGEPVRGQHDRALADDEHGVGQRVEIDVRQFPDGAQYRAAGGLQAAAGTRPNATPVSSAESVQSACAVSASRAAPERLASAGWPRISCSPPGPT